MQRYILMRALQALITLFFVSMLIFGLARLSGDPLDVMMPMEASEEDYARARKHLGLDKPLPVQYAIYISQAVTGDLGTSLRAKIPVSQLLMERLPNSLRLAGFSITIAMSLALFLGMAAAVKKGSIIDTISRIFAVGGMSIPIFWLAIMAVLLFSVHLHLLPSSRAGGFKHYILPAFILGWSFSAPMMRLLRSSMLEVLDSEYVKLARIKGVSERWVIWKHALRNALIPVITFAGFYLGLLVGGVVVTETVFAWPGVGLLAYESVLWRDYPVIQGVVLFITTSILTINLGVDILYAYFDPRIRY
jgi:peptide/nickel transport system permease protein